MNRTVVYSDPGSSLQTEIVESPIPEPGDGEVLVRLSHSGVCQSDISFCLNRFEGLPAPTPKGQIGGHEGIGIVIKRGANVSLPEVDARVGISYAADACLTCDRCIQGGESSCVSSKISGYFTAGTFQQYVVSPARYVIPIPEALESSVAAPLMCGGLSVYTALKRAGVRPGSWVAISGAGGGLGHMAIQFARSMSGRVLALDVGHKKQFCMDLGADAFVDFTVYEEAADMATEIKRVTGGGASMVLMCSSSGKAYSQAMSWLGFRGTLACLGIPKDNSCLVPHVQMMIGKELKITASKTGNRLEAQECLQIASRGDIKPQVQIRRMEEVGKVFEELEAGQVHGRVVIDLEFEGGSV